MSNRLFSANCPVVHCAPKRVRRTWGRTLLDVLMLLALAALAGWLLHVLRSAAQGTVRTTMGPQTLAMAATGGGMSPAVATWLAWGVLTLCLAGLGALAWRRIMEWHAVGEFVDELQRASAAEEKAEMLKPETLKTDHGLAPAATTRARMPREDVRRIVEACQQECRDARTLVESARQTLSVDDYEDALVGAARRLKQVVSCLGNLVDELSEKAEMLKTETLKDAFRVGPPPTKGGPAR